ncbi:MAG: hypothetical protein ACLTMF_07120 [Alistipes putredinis]
MHGLISVRLFRSASMLASTWDEAAIERRGAAMGNEVLEYGCDVILGPGMNIHRHPPCGRNFEYIPRTRC